MNKEQGRFARSRRAALPVVHLSFGDVGEPPAHFAVGGDPFRYGLHPGNGIGRGLGQFPGDALPSIIPSDKIHVIAATALPSGAAVFGGEDGAVTAHHHALITVSL